MTTITAEYRSIDGSGNNQTNPEFGAADSLLLRTGPVFYEDGVSSPSGSDRPNPREVSNAVIAQDELIDNSTGISTLFVFWGQFLDHDLSFTLDEAPETLPVTIPADDQFLEPGGLIPFTRSDFDPETGTGPDNPREQTNVVTSFIDASTVYGSDPEREAFVRDEGGKLKVTEGGFLPLDDGTQQVLGGDPEPAFVAGDLRANENTALTAMHTLFVREHNRLVDEIAAENPDYTDEQLYQEAKAIVEAQVQHVTYNEFLPLLLGEDALPEYQGYDPTVNADVNHFFSAVAFRLGHTLLSPTIDSINEDGSENAFPSRALRDAFFLDTSVVIDGDIDPILRGIASTSAQEFDAFIIDDVRNFLVAEGTGELGLDLAVLNIQRARDHGLPGFNEARELLGLERYTDFSQITADVEVQQALAGVYDTVDQIDPWVGGVAEDPVEGAMVGEFFFTVLTDQFTRARDGDRFWYETRLDEETLEQVRDTTLADIILRNTSIQTLQDDAFLAHARQGGSHGPDVLEGGDGRDLLLGNGGNDVLFGSAGNDALFGGWGDDELFGGSGSDMLEGGNGEDRLMGGPGSDILHGGGGCDRLYGGEGDDELSGGACNDILFGDSGDDTLDGGHGNDMLYGGSGSDLFVFRGNWGRDKIEDFTPGEDLIQFAGTGAAGFDDLTIHSADGNARVSVDGNPNDIVTITGLPLEAIDQNDFVFIS